MDVNGNSKYVRVLASTSSNSEGINIIFEETASVDEITNLIDPMNYLYDNYKKSGNSVYALRAFLIASEQGVYAPDWVMQWLNDSFADFDKSKGVKTIDKCLGLIRGKSGTSAVTKANSANVEYYLMSMMDVIRSAFQADVDVAAELVSAFTEDLDDWNKPGSKIKSYSVETLIDYYYRKWSENSDVTSCFNHWSKDDKEEFLQQFPSEAVKNCRKFLQCQ